MSEQKLNLDGRDIAFEPGQTIMEAAQKAQVYIPHLCYHPEFKPHGSCRLCVVKVDGRFVASCTFPAAGGQKVESNTADLNLERRRLVQMLFVEGNHFCPSCEKSGNCQLQAVAYFLGMTSPHYNHFFPDRTVDASHPDVLLDRNRCIACDLCVRASREADGKDLFALGGRGVGTRIVVNSPDGKLGSSNLTVDDKAVHVCPTGALLPKRVGFAVPVGSRTYDKADIAKTSLAEVSR